MKTKLLDGLRLQRMGSDEPAGLWITSLPWPRLAAQDRFLDGRSTFVQPLGQWPHENAVMPRRLLMVADGENRAPESLAVTREGAVPAADPPLAAAEVFAGDSDPTFLVEQSLLRIQYGGRSLGLAMGLRTADGIHWWEATRMVVLNESPACRTVEMGGAIAYEVCDKKTLLSYPGVNNPFLHRHNWVNGRIIARLHANGVCEIYAHHINAKFVDDGLLLKDAVPVIGITVEGGAPADLLGGLAGPWDGQARRVRLGNVEFDLTEAAHLACKDKPGRFEADGGFVVWQPYEAMELYGGDATQQRTGDPFVYRSEQKIIGHGMARTVRFSLSLSDRCPRVARYIAPAWWFGLCEELTPHPLLPVHNIFDEDIENCRKWLDWAVEQGGFEDGEVPRFASDPNRVPKHQGKPIKPRPVMPKNEPGWEGDVPYGMFVTAWHTGQERDFDLALRAAYHFTDLAVNHATKAVRMHGWPPPAISLPMHRILGTLTAYLETGDPYLYETACAVTDNAYWVHKNSWPRLAVGRDACFVRGAVMLYRYFADDHYRRIAHDGCMAIAHVQLPNGSFGDQGGGTGIHMRSGYVVKPWMGTLGISPLIDYLELIPNDKVLAECVKKFGDWLLNNVWERPDGSFGWSYQHGYGSEKRHFNAQRQEWMDLPTQPIWHSGALARILGYCSLRFRNPAYLDVFQHSHESHGSRHSGDHSVSAATQYFPWLQMQLWQAKLDSRGTVVIRGVHFGPRTPRRATVQTPRGVVEVEWTDDGRAQAKPAEGVELVVDTLAPKSEKKGEMADSRQGGT